MAKDPALRKKCPQENYQTPQGYVRDSGLLHHLLHLTEQEDILSHPSLGQSWESMVIEKCRFYVKPGQNGEGSLRPHISLFSLYLSYFLV